ncbi:MAG: HAD family phosphatase [Deltaproteobacteria bacterium]|nr:MAG: HAD family phosphatase [Deltaproteobacteria bacterium]
MTVRAVVFDFGNVIYRFDRNAFIGSLASDTGKDPDLLYKVLYGSDLPLLFERGEIGGREFFERFSEMAGLSLDYGAFVRHFCSMFSPVEGMEELVREVATRLPVGLLSNTNEVHHEEVIEKCPVYPLFSAVVVSYSVGAMKPEREIYLRAVREMGTPPAEILFVDDVEENVEGARRAGLQGLLFEGPEKLRRDLKKLGVLP